MRKALSNTMIGVLMRGNLDIYTEGRQPHENRQILDLSLPTTNTLGTPRIADNQQRLQEERKACCLEILQEVWPDWHVDFCLLASEL